MLKNVEDGRFAGGIENLGTYKEGSCFKLITNIESWILCDSSSDSAYEYMKDIAVLKLR
jgi:hypothetical protein